MRILMLDQVHFTLSTNYCWNIRLMHEIASVYSCHVFVNYNLMHYFRLQYTN